MPHAPQLVDRIYARVLSEVFPSTLTVRLDGYSVSAAGLCAHLAAVAERDQCSPETDALVEKLQRAYREAAWYHLDRDLPTICKQQRTPQAYETARELVCPGRQRSDPDHAKLERRRKRAETAAAADAARRDARDRRLGLKRCRCLRACRCSINP